MSPQLPNFLQSTPAEIHEKFVDLEWQQRHRLRQGKEAGSQWALLQNDEVKERNRYINIDPYDANRVKLKVPEGMSDYINASPIVLKSHSGNISKYIAMQGPKESGIGHVWRMIWHETSTVAVIVMVTPTHDERGYEKCFQYFPVETTNPKLELNIQDEFGDGEKATVTLVNAKFDQNARCMVSKLRMQVGEGEKVVYHLLFMGWPDFLVPEGEDRVALMELIKLSQRLNAEGGDGATNPRIVHCSAGVGRTGTFIALDHLFQELEAGELESVGPQEDRVLETVDALRKQRMMMVQMEGQFRFLYDVLGEKWVAKYAGTGT